MAFNVANDGVASEWSIFSENQCYKSFLHITVNPYVPIFWDLDVRDYTHTFCLVFFKKAQKSDSILP